MRSKEPKLWYGASHEKVARNYRGCFSHSESCSVRRCLTTVGLGRPIFQPVRLSVYPASRLSFCAAACCKQLDEIIFSTCFWNPVMTLCVHESWPTSLVTITAKISFTTSGSHIGTAELTKIPFYMSSLGQIYNDPGVAVASGGPFDQTCLSRSNSLKHSTVVQFYFICGTYCCWAGRATY